MSCELIHCRQPPRRSHLFAGRYDAAAGAWLREDSLLAGSPSVGGDERGRPYAPRGEGLVSDSTGVDVQAISLTVGLSSYG